jgi:NADPH2:quinone reductase
MRAVVVQEPGPPENLRLSELPQPAARRGNIVVRVDAAGVNPVDAGTRADPYWAEIEPPYVVGYEFAGSVVEVGDGVAGLAERDLVWGLLPVRGTRWGTYAQYVEVDARLVGPRPPELDAASAAGIPLAGSTALQVLDRLALRPGDSLLVHGASGGVGTLLVQLARHAGIRVAGTASAARQTLLEDLGVEWPVDREHGDAVAAALERRGRRFEAVADLVGHGLLAESLRAIAEGGAAATIVELRGDFDDAIDRNITLHGVLVRPARAYLDRLADAVDSGALVPVVDGVVDFESIVDAHRRVESGRGGGKVILRIPA